LKSSLICHQTQKGVINTDLLSKFTNDKLNINYKPMNKLFSFVLAVFFAALSLPALAQLNLPQASPLAKVNQIVGLTEVNYEYSRPSLKGRTAFGGIEPYDKVWRTGANNNTLFTFSDEVTIMGQKLPAGTYSLFTIPAQQGEWTVIFSKNTKQWGSDQYNQEEDALRVRVAPAKVNKVETFTINIANITTTGAHLDIMWDETKVSVPFTVEVEAKTMANINKAVSEAKSDDWRTLAQAANYLQQENRDLPKATEYIKKSVAIQEHFWNLYIMSEIQAKNGDFTGALASANKSLPLAKEAKNNFYAGQNEKNIAAWKDKAGAKKGKAKGKKS
jgi:hypothetical protein